MSAATIRAYRDTWKLFLAFLSESENVPAHELRLKPTHPGPGDRLPRLPRARRGNSAATGNLRLAAIKAVMAFQATRSPEHLDTIARITPSPSRSTRNHR